MWPLDATPTQTIGATPRTTSADNAGGVGKRKSCLLYTSDAADE